MIGRASAASSGAAVVAEDLSYICEGLHAELSKLEGKKLLITGGAGFLGYYLVQAISHWNATLADAPIRLTVYDNYIRGVPAWLMKLANTPHVTLTRYDICDPLPTDIGDYQYIIHAASIASPTYYRQYPIQTMDANVGGLRRLLEYCRLQQDQGQPVEGMLFYSTSEIYGDPDPANIPTPETYRGNVSCTGPRACYDESKRFGETLCVNFAHTYGLSVKVARPFNNYGPGLRMTDRRVIPDFARDILAGNNIVILSDGSPTRTYCYVADAIIGYYKVLISGRPGEAYNIGADSPEISISNLANRMAEMGRDMFGYTGHVVLGQSSDADYLTDNPHRRCPSLAKARQELGYEPRKPLDEGLARTMLWYRDVDTSAEGVQ